MYNDVWMALLTLKTKPQNIYYSDFKEAFVQAFVTASSKGDAVKQFNIFSMNNDFTLTNIEDIELFEDKVLRVELSKEFLEIAIRVANTNEPEFSTFHIFEEE